MADITNEEFIRWVNEVIRPLAETLRSAGLTVDSTIDEWNRNYLGLLGGLDGADDVVLDGRESQGVSRLTGADIKAFIAAISALQSGYQAGKMTDVIYKPCVKPVTIK